jgi:DNA transposition AAA+ family ATPase
MSILAARKPHLLSLGLPSDTEMIRRTRHFVLRSGLTLAELADMADLNPSSLCVYLSGRYDAHQGAASNTLAVRAALKQVKDHHELDHPEPAQGKHYETAEFKAIRDFMWTALREGTAALVDGPPGSKKSVSFEYVIKEINASGAGRAIYLYCDIDQSPQSFLIEACTEAGIPNRGSIAQLIRKLRFFLGGQRALLVVDEAQHLPPNTLETLRKCWIGRLTLASSLAEAMRPASVLSIVGRHCA